MKKMLVMLVLIFVSSCGERTIVQENYIDCTYDFTAKECLKDGKPPKNRKKKMYIKKNNYKNQTVRNNRIKKK